MERRVTFGHAGVDSGMLTVVDPCYWTDTRNDGHRPVSYVDDVLSKMITYDPTERSADYATVRDGIVFGTQIGDGAYPVVGVYDRQGNLLRVEILIHQDEEEE